jgi:hypothetical protein
MNPPITSRPGRADFAIAAAIIALAFAISPLGIRLATGRLDLSPRIIVLALIFDAFLLIVAAAVLSWGRLQTALFHILMLTSPLVLLAAIEAAAIGIHLADRIAPLEDMSILANKDHWPGHFMSASRKVSNDGLQLYQPWRDNDITINDLGLRTAPPAPKIPGEWRVAITGGSVAFGWRMRDVDTIPVEVQSILRGGGHPTVTVYNFGIDSVVVADELALLKRFRTIYDIDQVVFLTGANDVTSSYMGAAVPPDGASGLLVGINGFELLKAAGRLKASMSSASPTDPPEVEKLLSDLAQGNSLRTGLLAADEFCRTSALTCDFVLQPVLLRRTTPVGPEIKIARTLRHVYPGYEQAFATMYRTAQSATTTVRDLSDAFDRSIDPYFIDIAHLNEAGNRMLAIRLAEIITARLPGSAANGKSH